MIIAVSDRTPASNIFKIVVVQLLSHVRLFVTPGTAACQASLSFTVSRSLLKLMSIKSVMPSNHPILCCPLLLPSVFLSIRVFSSESVLRIRWPKNWSLSFSINPSNEYSELNIQDWLVWSPCSPRVSLETSPAPQFEGVNSLALSFLYGPTLTSMKTSHDYRKTDNFEYADLCWQSDVSAFQYAV